MATQRQTRAKNTQLTHVLTAMNIAGSYGKEELAAGLDALAKQIENDELTWNPDWITGRLLEDNDDEELRT